MDIIDFASAIFIGNIMTASFLWGASRMARTEKPDSMLLFGSMLMPIAIALLSLSLTGLGPPFLDAIFVQAKP